MNAPVEQQDHAGLGLQRGEVYPLSVAPMMKCTDRHFRYMMRLISGSCLLYTEMVTAQAIAHGDRDRLLGFDPIEHPIAVQLGGDDAALMAECARIAVEDYGYDEVNINVGCPSERVQSGNFGACLMTTPEVVADCVAAMREVVEVPVTVKHRIGVDEVDQYEHMLRFVDVVSASGADRFSVHARKAWLKGLSPKENRNIPPLRYEEIYRLKRERPEQVIEINGGIRDLDATAEHLDQVDAVMIGRAVYDAPYLFAEADSRFFGTEDPGLSRHEVARAMLPYIEAHLRRGGALKQISRHMLQLFAGQRGAKAWRRHLAENAHLAGAGPEVIEAALALVPEAA